MGKRLDWKRLAQDWSGAAEHCSTWRAQIPGGWLVSCWSGHKEPSNEHRYPSVTFVPDPGHDWDAELFHDQTA